MNKKPIRKRNVKADADEAGKSKAEPGEGMPRSKTGAGMKTVADRKTAENLSVPYTGRMLVQLDAKTSIASVIRQAKAVGLQLTTLDGEGTKKESTGGAGKKEGGNLNLLLGQFDGVIFEQLRLVIVNEGSAAKLEQLLAVKDSAFVHVEPERKLRATQAGSKGKPRGVGFKDSTAATWGIQAMNILASNFTGKGVKVAVLDTGFDFTHPDFSGRTIHRKCFTGAKQALDKEGHGTHCAGIACGGRKGAEGARYGVAPGARLYIGKILDDAGEGTDGQALAGIEWALEKGCQVISMSLGAPVDDGLPHSAVFEAVAQVALKRGSLLLAAAGNESSREDGEIGTVNHPANCPSIVAVGGLTQTLHVGDYSCAGSERSVGQVDIAAPGDQVLSARPGGRYQRQTGTSMATAMVAGVAALLWEQYPDAHAAEIGLRLMQQARRLPWASKDVGVGLASV